jgi:arginyl-tRNA synthetase
MNTIDAVRERFREPLRQLVADPEPVMDQIRRSQEPKFGDYQANFAMQLAKQLGKKPREIAQMVVDRLGADAVFSSLEVAGPGFINLRLSDPFLVQSLRDQARSRAVGIAPDPVPKTMIVDYSSPNVAKPMHVGHLRSTIIGDAIARLYRALGWKVVADNHLGDWGLQFGMLIYGWRHLRDDAAAQKSPIHELARLYKAVNKLAGDDPDVERICREETAKLHAGDLENLALWRTFMPWCLEDLAAVYRRLDIHFDLQQGESFYQPMLREVVDDLKRRQIATESDSAICVFFPDPAGKVDDEGKPVDLHAPTIVQKSDGAFTYATTDLACVKERVESIRPDVIVYVVDDRQSLHLQQVFAAAQRWGYDQTELVHVMFGKITDTDGRPYKTREGGTVGLESLLDEAVQRARRVVDENSPDLSDEERAHVAEVVGLGAVKYADLSQNRISDYVFDWDKMISLQGNTATYLQYVYARNRSIFRKGDIDPGRLDFEHDISLAHPSERALALRLVQFGESVEQAARDYKPNLLTNYLFDLANAYNGFFRDCRVLQAETDDLRVSRLLLCELTARVIRQGLDLLGIGVVERM